MSSSSPKKEATKEELAEFEVGEKYHVHGPVLGKGAWSEVRRCRPLESYKCPVSGVSDLVVKMIDRAHLVKLTRGDEVQAEGEVQRELNTLSKLPQHPNIAVFIESIKSETHHHLVFEAAPNGDLCEKILGCAAGKLDPVAARRYTFQMVQSILHCHQAGIAHRDIKPENMLLGQGDMLKLTDFGLAKINPNQQQAAPPAAMNGHSSNGNHTPDPTSADDIAAMAKGLLARAFPEPEVLLCSEVVGTPYYGAPEMFDAKSKGAKYDGYLADAWSLGVVVFIMLTGSFPFSPPKGVSDKETYEALAKSTLSISSEVPATAADFIKKLLHKDPSKRMKLSQALDHLWMEPLVIEEEMAKEKEGGGAAAGSTAGSGNSNFHDTSSLVQKHMLRLLRRQVLEQQAAYPEPVVKATPGGSGVSSAGKRATSPTVSRVRQPVGGSASSTMRSPAPSPNPTRGATPTRRLAAVSPGPTARASTPTGSTRGSTPTPSSSLPTTPKVAGATAGKPGGSTSSTVGARGPVSPAPAPGGTTRTSALRANSPLARSSPTVRRGTPLRTGATPSGTTPGTAQRSSSLVAGRSPAPGGSTTSSVTPVRRPGTMPLRSPAPGASSPSTAPSTGAGGTTGAAASAPLAVGQKVMYKAKDAIVKFRGETGFAPGLWLGLEMATSGGEGLHDGRSYVDKVRYFECPKGHGVFVRETQVTRTK